MNKLLIYLRYVYPDMKFSGMQNGIILWTSLSLKDRDIESSMTASTALSNMKFKKNFSLQEMPQ